MNALRWSYMDHWRADSPRGPVTQYTARRHMDDFVKQISAVGFEGLDMFDFQVFALTGMFGSVANYQDYLRDHGIDKIVNLFRGIMYDPRLADPQSHPEDQSTPGPADRVPRDWQAVLTERS